jgi:hypothetical protein
LITRITGQGTISQKEKIEKTEKENKSQNFSNQKYRKSKFLANDHSERVPAHHPPDF